MTGAWNWMRFKVPSSPSYSMVLWFYSLSVLPLLRLVKNIEKENSDLKIVKEAHACMKQINTHRTCIHALSEMRTWKKQSAILRACALPRDAVVLLCLSPADISPLLPSNKQMPLHTETYSQGKGFKLLLPPRPYFRRFLYWFTWTWVLKLLHSFVAVGSGIAPYGWPTRYGPSGWHSRGPQLSRWFVWAQRF